MFLCQSWEQNKYHYFVGWLDPNTTYIKAYHWFAKPSRLEYDLTWVHMTTTLSQRPTTASRRDWNWFMILGLMWSPQCQQQAPGRTSSSHPSSKHPSTRHLQIHCPSSLDYRIRQTPSYTSLLWLHNIFICPITSNQSITWLTLRVALFYFLVL